MEFSLPSGSQPLERYTIRRGIGMGGFGEVYFAASDAGKEVALKRIQRNMDVELRGVAHCMNLKHPNLISLHDVCYDASGGAWVVMEYAQGPNLRDVLDQDENGLPESEARRWFAGLAGGVAHLHESGLVHRDLKPGNVFDDAGIIKVGDYGLSKFISCSRRGGNTESVGTFHYMAPEIGRGEYGREIDLYALGVILSELLTGRLPFDGETSHEIVMKHLTATPDLTGVPEPYRGVIDRVLAKDPAARYASVAEMLQPLGMEMDVSGIVFPGSTILDSGSMPAPAPQATPELPPPVPVATLVSAPAGMEMPAEAGATAPNAAPNAQAQYQPSPAYAAMGTPDRQGADEYEEPLYRAVRQSLGNFKDWWTSLDSRPGTRFFVMAAIIVVGIMNSHWIMGLLTVVAVLYVPYYIVRQIVIGVGGRERFRQEANAGQRVLASGQPMSLESWKQHKRAELAANGSLRRLADVTGSWNKSVFVTVALGIGAGLFGLWDETVDPVSVAPFAWSTLTILGGAFAVLGLGKFWERSETETLSRRFALLGSGAAVGALAFFVMNALMIPADSLSIYRDVLEGESLPSALYSDDTFPRMSAFMAHFALLFALLRWWRNTDPLRRKRFSVFAVFAAVAGEWVLHQFLPIPQPWGMLIAGGLAVTTQVASPWIDSKERLNTEIAA